MGLIKRFPMFNRRPQLKLPTCKQKDNQIKQLLLPNQKSQSRTSHQHRVPYQRRNMKPLKPSSNVKMLQLIMKCRMRTLKQRRNRKMFEKSSRGQ